MVVLTSVGTSETTSQIHDQGIQFGQRNMECQHTRTCIARFLAVIICAHSAFGATNLNGPEAVEQGQNATFTCTADTLPDNPSYGWFYRSDGLPLQLFLNEDPFAAGIPKYDNFVATQGGVVMTIIEADVEDEGSYYCAIRVENSAPIDFTVEVNSTLKMELSTTQPLRAGTEYTATCDVIGSRPQLEITWILNDVALDGTPVTIPANPNANLSDTRSEVTFTATPEMNEQDLKCTTSGHKVTSLNRETTTQLNVEYAPTNETATIAVVTTKEENNKLRVTCQVSAFDNGVDPANPAINMYNIYAGSEQINKSTPEENSVLVDNPENVTNYKCSASNDVGTIESEVLSYDPGQTTTQPTTTGPQGTAPSAGDNDAQTGDGGLSTGATAGIVVGVLGVTTIVVVVLVVFLVKKKDSGPPPKTMALQEQKPTNGNSEKVAHPTAAPRQSTVPHRNDNPGGAVYAEVQKGGRGYDQPDHTHPPQADSGMNYATLDLSEEAGHTERQVPQNKDNVVVYSSILV